MKWRATRGNSVLVIARRLTGVGANPRRMIEITAQDSVESVVTFEHATFNTAEHLCVGAIVWSASHCDGRFHQRECTLGRPRQSGFNTRKIHLSHERSPLSWAAFFLKVLCRRLFNFQNNYFTLVPGHVLLRAMDDSEEDGGLLGSLHASRHESRWLHT